MSTTSTALMTAEELMQLPDDDLRHELVNGELITMPLTGLPHGRAAIRLAAPLAQFVWDHELGESFSRVGFQLTKNPDTVLGPDQSFISKERLEQAGEIKGYWQGPPDLAVEVLEPEDSPEQVNNRISQWLGFGVKQVWIVDSKHSSVTVHRSESDTTTFSGSDYLESQTFSPGSVFHSIRSSGQLGTINEACSVRRNNEYTE